jgi:Protein of unknown function (DUF3108)
VHRAWIVGLLIACGHPPASDPKISPTAPPSGDFPKGAPLVTSGERMVYKVSLRGLEVASYVITVGDVITLEGRKAISVQGYAKLAGLAAIFGGKVDDKFTSWIDIETGRSLRFVVDEYASKSNNTEHTVIEIGKRTENLVPVTFHLNNETPVPEPQKVTQPETWDYNAFLVAMRSWEAAPGKTQKLEIFRSRYMWNVTVTAKGKTKIKTLLQGTSELHADRYDAHLVKLARDGSKYPDTDERDFTLWVSNDASAVPIQMNARSDYGDIVMQLVEYAPGTGEPLRKN